jgi:hypothetical protein
MKFLLTLGLLASSVCVFAAPTVLVETPVTYSADAKVAPAIKQECRLEARMVQYTSKALRRANRRPNTTIAADGGDSRPATLRIQIVEVTGEGAVPLNEARAITVQAALLQGGEVSRRIKLTRSALGRSMSDMSFPEEVCVVLWRSAGAISKNLVRWAKDPEAKIAADANVKADEADGDADAAEDRAPAKSPAK